MTQRSPIYTRIGPREQPRELLTWVHTQIAIPPRPYLMSQDDWPLPQPQRPNLELRTWLNGLPPGVVGNPVPPIRLGTWPDYLPRRQTNDLLTWVETPQITAAVVQPPFKQTDWPNPQAQRPNLELRTWLNYNPVLPDTVGAPFRQTDWPNPQPQRPNLELRTWIDGIPQAYLSLTIPAGKDYWPDFFTTTPNLELRSWLYQPTNLPASVGSPFSQSDWPNPQLRQLTFQTDVGGTLLATTLAPPVITNPFAQYDWPNPQPIRYPVQPEPPPNLVAGTLYQATTATPFLNYDFPNPQPQPQNLELRYWLQNYSNQAPPPVNVVPADTSDGAGGPIFREAWIKKRVGKAVFEANRGQVQRADIVAEKVSQAIPEAASAKEAVQLAADDEETLFSMLQSDDELLREFVVVTVKLLRTLH